MLVDESTLDRLAEFVPLVDAEVGVGSFPGGAIRPLPLSLDAAAGVGLFSLSEASLGDVCDARWEMGSDVWGGSWSGNMLDEDLIGVVETCRLSRAIMHGTAWSVDCSARKVGGGGGDCKQSSSCFLVLMGGNVSTAMDRGSLSRSWLELKQMVTTITQNRQCRSIRLPPNPRVALDSRTTAQEHALVLNYRSAMVSADPPVLFGKRPA